jgi:hypothetical protein
MSMRSSAMSSPAPDVGEQSLRRTIFASAAGTMIEWYDFYIFGSLATVIASKFYHTGTPLGHLIARLATFAIGFVVRPFQRTTLGAGSIVARILRHLRPSPVLLILPRQ